MATPDPATLTLLRNALYAYMDAYGEGNSIESVRAIAGALLSVQAQAGAIHLAGMEMVIWVDALVQDFDPKHLPQRLWSRGEAAIAAQAKHWRDTLATRVRGTLETYLHRYTPDLNLEQFQLLVATILPVVEDAHISRDEVIELWQRLRRQVDWQSPISCVIDPQWLPLAETVWQAMRHQDIEATVLEIVQAYQVTFKPALVDMGEELVETALATLINRRTNMNLELDLDLDLDASTRHLLVKQVSFKLKWMEPGASPSKTAVEIAQQVQGEIARYRTAQGVNTQDYLPTTTVTDETTGRSVLGGPMGIGIQLYPSTPAPRPASGQDESGETPDSSEN